MMYKAEGGGFHATKAFSNMKQATHIKSFQQSTILFKIFEASSVTTSFTKYFSLFDLLHDDYHQVGMGNLYNSPAFCRAAYNNHPSRVVLCHGVTRKSGKDFHNVCDKRRRIK